MSTISVDADLLREALRLLEDQEWSACDAAGNIYCPECVAPQKERYKDQQDHHPGCRFVATRDGLRKALEESTP